MRQPRQSVIGYLGFFPGASEMGAPFVWSIYAMALTARAHCAGLHGRKGKLPEPSAFRRFDSDQNSAAPARPKVICPLLVVLLARRVVAPRRDELVVHRLREAEPLLHIRHRL